MGKRAEAEDEYRKGLAIQQKLAADYPTVTRYRASLVTSHITLGVLYLNQRKHQEAIEQARFAIRADSKFPNAHALLGLVLQQSGDIPAARAALAEAARLDPRFKPLLAKLPPPLPVAPPPREAKR